MAERTVIVCDVCGVPAQETVSFSAGGRNLQKDLCAEHLAELTAGARAPRRGRRPRLAAPASARTTARTRQARPTKGATKKSSRRARARKRPEGAEPTDKST
jgi:hypothetical protein